ncbi:MAG: RidA family protein [Alphaproteobacteria bacterium]|nr:RidA family protein [Alphaproteobacteria bacterium]
MTITRHNPDTVAAPANLYSQVVEVPPGARWLYLAGQVGTLPDGSMTQGFQEQHRQTWRNVIAILNHRGMGVEDIVKVVVYARNEEDVQYLREGRAEFVGDFHPASTWCVTGLAKSQWLVEMDVVAAKVD